MNLSESSRAIQTDTSENKSRKANALVNLGRLFGNAYSAENLYEILASTHPDDEEFIETAITTIESIALSAETPQIVLDTMSYMKKPDYRQTIKDRFLRIAKDLSNEEDPPIRSTILDHLETLLPPSH